MLLKQFILSSSSASGVAADLERVTAPITGLLGQIFDVAIPLVVAIGTIYCIILGLKLAKADEQQERERAKQALKNAIIGFVLIFVLVVALRIATPILRDWVAENSPSSSSSSGS